jgi:tripartite-type tricarboxylate transporter receptor subunit TctC
MKTLTLALLSAALAFAAPAFPQSYPNRAVTLVVPFAPGGGTDSLGRELARLLADKLGQSVVVDNRGGAGGALPPAPV